jgi:hypothetical protein
MRRIAALLVAGAFAGSAHAQGLAAAPAPIDLSVQPSVAVPGMRVQIGGTSVPMGPQSRVKVGVAPPGKPPTILLAPIDEQGTWSVQFGQTQAVGKYSVVVTAPDGRGNAQGGFEVRAAGAAATNAIAKARTFIAKERAAIKEIEEVFQKGTPSPPVVELEKKLQMEDPPFSSADDNLGKADEGLRQLGQLLEQYPALQTSVELMDAMGNLAQLADQLDKNTAELDKKIAAVKKTSNLCDDLDAINDALAFVSFWTDLIGKPLEKLNNLLLDKDLPDRLAAMLPPDQRSTNFKFTVSESFKGIAALMRGGPPSLGTLAAFASDLAGFVAAQVFDFYCEKFQGELQASYQEDLYNGNLKFWSYTEKLRGRVVLRYEKATGQPQIPLSGELEGNGTTFTLWEDLLVLEKDARVARNLWKKWDVAPLGVPYLPMAGRTARQLGPSSFSVPVTGTLKGDQLTLTIPEGGGADFSPAVAGRAVYLFMLPGSIIPDVQMAKLPFQKAWFVISRGTRGSPTFTVKAVAGRNYSEIDDSFTRSEKGAKFEVSFRVQIRACNPECP